MHPALLATAAAGGGTPIDYGDALKLWLDGEQGITESLGDVTAWLDQASSLSFTVPGGNSEPAFLNNTQNGLDGVEFVQVGGTLNRKLSNAANVLDNFFAGAGDKAIAFAGRVDDFPTSFNVNHSIITKGWGNEEGWNFDIKQDGSVRFRHYRANGSIWQVQAAGFYSESDLMMGTVIYDGGNTVNSGTLILYNGTNFVETGNVTVGSSSTIGDEDTFDAVVGNVIDTGDADDNRPFGGPLLGLWMTKPARTSIDQGYMARWITP